PSLVLITPDDAVLIDDAAEYVREKNSGEKFKQIFQRYSGPATIGNRFQSLFY
ncbi:thioredoxin family redox-active protein, partial [Cystoisospora suis]